MTIKESKKMEINNQFDSNFKEVLMDFFDFVIWESFSLILGEIKGDTNKKNINEFRNKLKYFFIQSVIKSQDQSEFNKNIRGLCKKTKFINIFSSDYILETISIFRKRLFEKFTEEELTSSKLDNDKLKDLLLMINQYVLISYFDKNVLSNIVKTLLYSSRISFAQINEFRIQIIEIFKEGLYGKKDLNKIDGILRDILDKMSLNPLIRDFILSNIFGYFSVILSTPIEKIIPVMKMKVFNKLTFNSDIEFLEDSKIKNIIQWIFEEIINPFFNLLKADSELLIFPSIEKIKDKIKEILEEELKKYSSIDSIIEELEELQKSIKLQFIKVKYEIIKEENNVITRFVQKEENNSFNKIQSKIRESETSDYNQTISFFFEALENLCLYLDEIMETDPKLDDFYKIIKEKKSDSYEMMYL